MQLSDFDFPFDSTLIATHPVHPRDHARLLVVPRGTGGLSHRQVRDLPEILQPGDVLVVNDTKVLPVRLHGHKIPGGGKIEMVLIKPRGENCWEVFLKGRVTKGQCIQLDGQASVEVVERTRNRTCVRIDSSLPIHELLHQIGLMPLPPYIKRRPTAEDRQGYQTVYATTEGAIAAPTAGLHFTTELLAALEARSIQVVPVTLHVGPGTFRPVTVTDIEGHIMDAEWFEVSEGTASVLNQAKHEGRRVVAVGTTSVRTLESAMDASGVLIPQQGETSLFISPGYSFRMVDAMLTNFHLPRSTLLMLVSAFAGHELIREAYKEAVSQRYRFYSFGDAMLIQ